MSDKDRGVLKAASFDIATCGLVIKHWARLMIRETERDRACLAEHDPMEQAYLCAKWRKLVDLMFSVNHAMERYESDRGKLDLVAQQYGDVLGVPTLAADIEARMDWYKKRLVHEFERSIKSDVAFRNITSPIEQIFLLEWRYLRVDEEYDVRLDAQKEVVVGGTTYRVDFVVSGKTGLKLGIEIDGHNFHEKTKEQAARDKARERSLTREGYILLRFTGSEVFKNPRKCVGEVIDLIAAKQQSTDAAPSSPIARHE